MKRMGFTLIELLAVIVILAIIALVAVPLVLNVIEESKQGAAKESATNYVKQAENVLVKSLMDGTSIIATGLYTLDNSGNIANPVILDVPMKGDKAKEGTFCVEEKGSITSYSLKVGNYYITSNDGTTQEITDTLVDLDCKKEEVPTPAYQVYANGTAIYFNPTSGEKCNASEANSATGTKSGCMKWYTFLDSEENSTVKLLLDHNTTASVAWNSSGSNTEGMKEVKKALEADTAGWKSEEIPRLITAQEVANISGNTTWDPLTSISTFYFGSNNDRDTSKRSEYGWMYDRTNKRCTSEGCPNNSNVATEGYWTDTPCYTHSSNAFSVLWHGRFYHGNVNFATTYGVRPVIVVAKSTIA